MGRFTTRKCLAYAGAFAFALGLAHSAGAKAPDHAAAAQTHRAGTADSPHPALFRIAQGKSTVYFLGSVHILPLHTAWHSPEIDKAIAASDVFLFEANIDYFTSEFDYFRRMHGYLAPGQTIYKMLSPDAQKK